MPLPSPASPMLSSRKSLSCAWLRSRLKHVWMVVRQPNGQVVATKCTRSLRPQSWILCIPKEDVEASRKTYPVQAYLWGIMLTTRTVSPILVIRTAIQYGQMNLLTRIHIDDRWVGVQFKSPHLHESARTLSKTSVGLIYESPWGFAQLLYTRWLTMLDRLLLDQYQITNPPCSGPPKVAKPCWAVFRMLTKSCKILRTKTDASFDCIPEWVFQKSTTTSG